MADLRLVGGRLGLVRSLIRIGWFRRALWNMSAKDFHVAEMLELPGTMRGGTPFQNTPLQSGSPRAWDDQGLGSGSTGAGAALRAAYRDRAATPTDVLERLIRRIEAADFGAATHSPFIALDLDRARADAAASSARWAQGAPLSAIDGVIVPVKDELHMKGLPTRGGCTYLEDPWTWDATPIERIRAAGGIVVGKTHATEWGLNPLGYNEHFDYPRNPWNAERGAGGSSTGSGVVVALGMATVAVGSDGGGSIRIPACINGVFGIKPTWVRMSRHGDWWGGGTLPHLGPIGASTEDLVDLLAVASGVDPNDAATRLAPDGHDVERPWRAALGRGVRGCRIGILRSEWKDAPPEIVKHCEAALEALRREGATLVDVDIPLAGMAGAIGAMIIASESTANADELIRGAGDRGGHEMAIIHALFAEIPARQLLYAMRTREALRRQVADVLKQVDLIAMPTTATPAVPYATSERRVPVMDTAATAKMTRYAFVGNLTGLPAGQIPVGLVDGLPVGLQLLGDAWDEASVFAAMAAAERTGVTRIGRPAGHRSLLG